MELLTTSEKRAKVETSQKTLCKLLSLKFSDDLAAVFTQIQAIRDPEKLEALTTVFWEAPTLEEFTKAL